MKDHLNSVKTPAGDDRAYHHGALRPALIAAAEAVIAERGVDGFSLREAARRAGVSPSAPSHHFKDKGGLLTAIATAAFQELGKALEEANAAGDRKERLRRQGIAYVDFALRQRARYDVMWRAGLLDRDDPEYLAASSRAFALLDGAVRGVSGGSPSADDLAIAPSIAVWSLVHGFARLALDGAFGTGEHEAERAAKALLPEVLRHLDV
jgi:AcrR family transcriptional regulator